MARNLPAVASLGVLVVLLLYVYGIVGWVIFDEHAPEEYGTVGQAMLTLFVMLSLENLPDNIELGLELSTWTVLYFISYTLLAAFLIFNLLIGVVIHLARGGNTRSSPGARISSAERPRRRPTTQPTIARVELVSQLQDLRRTLEAVEHDIKAMDEPAA
jgi:hypothetical protein